VSIRPDRSAIDAFAAMIWDCPSLEGSPVGIDAGEELTDLRL